MKPLPNIARAEHLDQSSLSPASFYAGLVGCPKKYLYLAGDAYSVPESYKIHPFKDIQVKDLQGVPHTVLSAKQLETASLLAEKLLRGSGGLTVINAHPDLSEGLLFLWHLVGSFANQKFKRPIQNKDSSFYVTANFRLEEYAYQTTKVGTLAIGPAVDEMNNYQVTGFIDALLRFDDFSRIILTSTSDLADLLLRLKIVQGKVEHIFNLSSKMDVPKPQKKKRSQAL